MNANEDRPPNRGSPKSTGLQERIGQIFYTYGLFCISYPVFILTFAITIALLCSYPLINFPLPGSLPVGLWQTSPNYTSGQPPEPPWCYVQQVILRIAVVPWADELVLTDAFRAPLYESFKLLETVRNYQNDESLRTLGHVCLHVESVKKVKEEQNGVLPEYSCLVLSPANFWHQDVQSFVQDSNIINTIFNHQTLQKGKSSLADMLFGMHLSDTGIKRYPLRNRRRILQYAITLFLKEYDETYVTGLRSKLQLNYPLHQNLNQSITSDININSTFIIQYPGDVNFYEYLPFVVALFLVFFYYYYSVRKMEVIKSRLGMAFSVIVTVQTSISMTFGLCFFFGLTLSSMAKQIFPYLVIIVGVENVLVLTKSVVSTPEHLDIKIRIAQGLSKEGWSITKNLLLEITILTIGLFTFIPFIQEFCIFGIVALISDFFLQMLFFSTILGIDTRRMESSSEKTDFRNNLYQNSFEKTALNNIAPVKGLIRSKSHPRLNVHHANVVHNYEKKIPKRVRLVNIWARTRFFQRSFMILMIAWISMILYNSGLMKYYFMDITENNGVKDQKNSTPINFNPLIKSRNASFLKESIAQHSLSYLLNNTEELQKLLHSEYSPWLKLSTQHWSSILLKYNVSLSGKHIAILPPITISHAIPPERALLLRNPKEKNQKFEWNSLAAALDPIDFSEGASNLNNLPQSERPLYPTSPMEIFLITILAIISITVLAYIVVVLYKTVCSRNYAEWRTSWTKEKTDEAADVPVMLEVVPIVLKGHLQEVECLATDGTSVVSSCLGGQLKVWDSVTGELQSTIDRNFFFRKQRSNTIEDCDDNNISDYESSSPPSRESSLLQFPSLKDKICLNFSNALYKRVSDNQSERFDFGEDYRLLYSERPQNFQSHNKALSWLRQTEQYRDEDTSLSCENLIQIDEKNEKNAVFIKKYKFSPIWCMDFLDNLVVIGCADGRLEFWEGTTGKFKYIYEDDSENGGVTSVKMIGSRVIAARLHGTIDFLQLQSYNQGRAIDWNFSCAYRRTHIRTGSTGSISDAKNVIQISENAKEDMRCFKVLCAKAHQQPITCLDCEGGRILTGSQDHTLKVFRLEDGTPLYTLHGHCGPITCLFIDRVSPGTSGSGSQDGMLCIWDLLTGTCMFSIQAHDGSVTSLTYSASYVISLGTDERICVWERFQGHLLNTIYVQNSFTSQVQMLSPHLVVTARSSSLVIYDVRTTEVIRHIVLGRSPLVLVNNLLMLRDSVVCDYANQLRIVRFPIITRKYD
ncbi:sterol regulatory element-binding protein cleavage-activating protein [Onthophagus taurus]|uniref:sterol regulatory element-binding protein cleavage-activating protein n=1 Tax=Onthophagus taurus TaxID=166361 RepID=UPI000C20F850|nr:sterol regulatory element-binding protein cleavage-activating protein [Onthophagus taurus]XP_022907414.1 sterol regulatory element-binding protein cleavage-activating protein [Onthophagus taurus]